MASEVATTPSPAGRMMSDAMTKPERSTSERGGLHSEGQQANLGSPTARVSARQLQKQSPYKPRAAQQLYTPGARRR